MALGTDFIVKYLSDISNAVKGAKDLEAVNLATAKKIQDRYGEVTKVIGKLEPKSLISKIPSGQFAGLTQEILKTGFVATTTNGKFLEFSKTQTIIGGQIRNTTSAIRGVSDAFVKSNIETEKAKKTTKSLEENLKFLGIRALTVIPIWDFLRTQMQSFKAVFIDGFRDLANESLALIKVKNTLQGTSSEIANSIEKIKKETQSLAIESGISHEKIIETFQKFSAVGLDVATAMTATNATIKLSVITQNDAVNSAESLSHAFSVLIDNNLSVIDKQKQINDIISLTAELWKTNGFNIEEFTGSLEKFAITAKSVNFTTSETLALLATLSKSGLGSAGNLLRNSIGQLLVNVDKLAGSLGVKVNPALDDTFTILVKVLEQLNQLQKVNDLKGLESAKEALKDIFGGTRSAVPITALSALYDTLKKNISLTPDINKLNDSFKDTESVLGNVVARYHTVNSEIGKAIVTGIVGGDDFNASLENIVITLNKLIGTAEKTGEAIAGVFSLGTLPVLSTWNKAINENNKAINDLGDAIISGLRGKLNTVDFNDLLAKLEVARKKIGEEINQFGISDEDLQKRISSARRLSDTINLIKKAGPLVEKTEGDVTEKQNKSLQQQVIYQKDGQEIAKLVLTDSIDRLKKEGALASQILIATQLRSQQLGIEEKTIDKLNRKLEIERAINEEKRLQSRLSSDTMKLFDIAKTEGVKVAKDIGDVLSGNTSFDIFVRKGGKDLEIFKKQFKDLFEQQQALQFFTGNRVAELPTLRGGTNIAIQEQAIRKPLSQYDVNLAMAQRAAEQQFQRLTNITATVPVTVNAQIDISKLSEVKDQFVKEVTRQLPQVGSDVNNALNQALLGKQGANL